MKKRKRVGGPITETVLLDSKLLTKEDVAFYTAVKSYRNNDENSPNYGDCFPTFYKIVKRAKMDQGLAYEARKKFVKLGLLKYTAKRGRPKRGERGNTKYWFLFDDGSEKEQDEGKDRLKCDKMVDETTILKMVFDPNEFDDELDEVEINREIDSKIVDFTTFRYVFIKHSKKMEREDSRGRFGFAEPFSQCISHYIFPYNRVIKASLRYWCKAFEEKFGREYSFEGEDLVKFAKLVNLVARNEDDVRTALRRIDIFILKHGNPRMDDFVDEFYLWRKFFDS